MRTILSVAKSCGLVFKENANVALIEAVDVLVTTTTQIPISILSIGWSTC